jgi:hypothetical protein
VTLSIVDLGPGKPPPKYPVFGTGPVGDGEIQTSLKEIQALKGIFSSLI